MRARFVLANNMEPAAGKAGYRNHQRGFDVFAWRIRFKHKTIVVMELFVSVCRGEHELTFIFPS